MYIKIYKDINMKIYKYIGIQVGKYFYENIK